MYHKHHTRGIVLWSKSEGDESRRVGVFTENLGFLHAKVQGAKNNYSKLRAGSQDFCIGEFSLVYGKGGWKIVSAKSLKNVYEVFSKHPTKLKASVNILNLIGRLLGEEETSNPLFLVTLNFLNFLEGANDHDVLPAECLTLLRILHFLGYMGHLRELEAPVASFVVGEKDLEAVRERGPKIIELINESLRVTTI